MLKFENTEFFESETGGGRIAFDVIAPNAPTRLLVLVNGFQRPRTDFRVFRKRLHAADANLATVAIDNRGIGETTYQEDSSVTLFQMAVDVKHIAMLVANRLNLKVYAVLGISMGGMIGIQAAYQNSNLSHLILVSTTGGGALRTFPDSMRGQKEFPAWPTDYDGMMARMSPYFGKKFLKKAPLLVDAMVKGMLKGASSGAVQKSSSLQYNAGRGFDGESILKTLNIRTLIVTGDEDHIMPDANSISLHRAIVSSTLAVYEGVGHLILVEEPERFVADVLRFLQEG